ncbi:MAG TPA: GtrA family protein [Polyangiaceae bacterium]|nr:GtrA family protein [Polyangiaceae bacterium]
MRTLVAGRFHDEEMDGRGLGGLTTARMRHFVAWVMRPLWLGLATVDVPPNAITTLSVGLAAGAGLAAAVGRFALAGWVFLMAGALDFIDGRVARVTGRASPGGAALDSVLDRYCESALLVGLAWYYRSSWALLPALLALTGSLLVPYVRARGESLGARMKDVGFMQRPERIVVLGASVAFAPIPEALLAPDDPHPPHRLAMAGLVLLAFTSHVTAIQRLLSLLKALGTSSVKSFRLMPRAVLVSVLATSVDAASVHALVHGFAAPMPLATLLGCAVGGTVAFSLSRFWVYRATNETVRRQVVRFLFVSGSSALLNAGGVWMMSLLPAVHPYFGWLITRALVFACWNFPLHSEWAFPERDREGAEHLPELGSDELGGKSAADAS